MRNWFFCLFIISSPAFALDAVITVLESPMLKSKSYDAPVVQYLRKGDVIKIHPGYEKDTRYDHMAPSAEKLAQLKKEYADSPEWNQDPLFKGKVEAMDVTDEFIATLDRQGHRVYVIRDHLYIYYANAKELNETGIAIDPTDYRLEEPLPKNYPLLSPKGYRGQFTLGVSQPYYESYPYLSSIKTKGYMSPIDVNVTLLRQRPKDDLDRTYYGVTLNFRTYTNDYSLLNGINAKERGLRFGFGPYISYDAFKGTENRISLYGNVNLNLFNQINVYQQMDNVEEQRNYRTISFSPRIGVQYHRKQIFPEIDFVLGSSIEMEPAATYYSGTEANQYDWWVGGNNDKFKTRTTFTLSGYLGLQSAY